MTRGALIPVWRSLRFRLVLISLLVEIIMLGLLLANSLRLLNETLEAQTQARLEAVTPLLDAALAGPLFARDHATLNEILNKLVTSRLSEFQYIVVYDNRGRVYARQGAVDVRRMPRTDATVKDSLSDQIFDASAPLQLAGQTVGEVRYGLTLKSLIASRDLIFTQGFAIASGEVLLSFILLAFGGYWLTRNIRILMHGARRVASGDYSQPIPVSSKDEIAQLAADFNAMTAAIRDRIDALRRSEKALFEEKERAEVTLHSIAEGVIATDVEGRVVYLNPVAESLTGHVLSEARGEPVARIYRTLDEATQAPTSNPALDSLREQTVITRQARITLVGDGRRHAVEDTAAPIRGREGQVMGAVLVFRDVTATRELALQLEYHASHDALTGLVNRREFEREVEAALAEAGSLERESALCYLDLDQFKVVNDTCGHPAGDELLRQLARLIRSKVRDADTVGRLGGDEFGVLLHGCGIHQAESIARDIRDSVRGYRFAWEARRFEVGVSIGLVPIRADSGGLAEIFSAADVACYVAKDKGSNQIHVYQVDDIEHARRRGEMQWSTRISVALKENRFVLYVQRIEPISAAAGDAAHYEILVRMVEEDGKIVLPARFIGAAERYHQMIGIDRWVVQQALTLLQDGGGLEIARDAMFTLNLSGQTLGSTEFLSFVKHAILTSGIDASRLCFEITETAAIANLGKAASFIAELKAMGCRFALDDFGSGLSSFAYLKALPVEYLKIDGTFIKDMMRDTNDLAMVTAINQVGHMVGIQTIAECVENAATLEKLREIGVDFAQGYYLHQPEEFRMAGDSVCWLKRGE
ncbi:MAG: EAL domain-containing protein [Pseudomonadota bacterium]